MYFDTNEATILLKTHDSVYETKLRLGPKWGAEYAMEIKFAGRNTQSGGVVGGLHRF